MDSLYKAEGVEERWQQTWEAEGHYNADPDPSRESFVIAHPPPNVTGDLHMGHALQLSLADTMVRMRRMQGYNTLFQPGFDHAGISTQNAVEKHLALEGKTRQDLGREAFEARVWEWLREYGGKIMLQFRRIGASLDYRRERFTMDEAYTRAVMRFFVHLYEKGWIYRANRIINWCPFHQTALSDLEVAHKDVDDALTYVRYPLADGDGSITIATVRPATILGDVAVAVHPDDERYRELVGREVVVPVVGRRVPVIADERVERDFGTGALKVTPGHDPLDYELGRDHVLARAHGDRAGRADERGGRRARRADAGGGRRTRPRVAEGTRSAREARELQAHGCALRPLPEPHRAAHLAPVVVLDDGTAEACIGGAPRPAASAITRSHSTASRFSRSRTRRTGTSPARSGGAISSPSGNVRTGTSPSQRRSPRRARNAAPAS